MVVRIQIGQKNGPVKVMLLIHIFTRASLCAPKAFPSTIHVICTCQVLLSKVYPLNFIPCESKAGWIFLNLVLNWSRLSPLSVHVSKSKFWAWEIQGESLDLSSITHHMIRLTASDWLLPTESTIWLTVTRMQLIHHQAKKVKYTNPYGVGHRVCHHCPHHSWQTITLHFE